MKMSTLFTEIHIKTLEVNIRIMIFATNKLKIEYLFNTYY